MLKPALSTVPRTPRPTVNSPVAGSEDALVARLRAGDEAAFRQLLGLHHGNMVGLARSFVRSRETAEEVAQDTWLAVIEGIDAFEQRSGLKAWIYAILVNKARTRAVRDGRMVALSELSSEVEALAVDADRFSEAGAWIDPPRVLEELTPERHAAGRELLAHMRDALDKLPALQRAVIILRDIEGTDAEEACNILGISETNQRVLLHRGRTRLRSDMERLMTSPDPPREARHA
jgi:RNA polymerase sigma-70 factor, ECF subfamily